MKELAPQPRVRPAPSRRLHSVFCSGHCLPESQHTGPCSLLCLSTEKQVGGRQEVITEPSFLLSPLLWLHRRRLRHLEVSCGLMLGCFPLLPVLLWVPMMLHCFSWYWGMSLQLSNLASCSPFTKAADCGSGAAGNSPRDSGFGAFCQKVTGHLALSDRR